MSQHSNVVVAASPVVVPAGLAELIAAELLGTTSSAPVVAEVVQPTLEQLASSWDSWGMASKPTASTRIGTQYSYGGFSVCQLLRWMGAQGYKPSDAKKALAALGIVGVSPSTVNCQLVGGRNGSRGKVPELGDELASKVCEAAGYEWVEATPVAA